MTINENFRIQLAAPSVDDSLLLREKVGWQNVLVNDVKISLKNSFFHITVYAQEQLVGMGRVVGDGAILIELMNTPLSEN